MNGFERYLAKQCSECEMCYIDNDEITRCSYFHDAILETIDEKHCEDSWFA